MCQLEADRDADEHAEPGLVCDKRTQRGSSLTLVSLARDTVHLGVVGVTEPAAFGERVGKHSLKRGRGMNYDILRVRKPSRFDQRRQRRVNFGCGVGAII
jgi:hypothetical protein